MPNLTSIKAPYSETVVLRASRQQNAQQHKSNWCWFISNTTGQKKTVCVFYFFVNCPFKGSTCWDLSLFLLPTSGQWIIYCRFNAAMYMWLITIKDMSGKNRRVISGFSLWGFTVFKKIPVLLIQDLSRDFRQVQGSSQLCKTQLWAHVVLRWYSAWNVTCAVRARCRAFIRHDVRFNFTMERGVGAKIHSLYRFTKL